MNFKQEIVNILHAADEMKAASKLGVPNHHMQISKGYLAQKADILYRAAEALKEATT